MSNKSPFILTAWSLVFCAFTLIWIFKNTVPPSWDQAHYLGASAYLENILRSQGILSFFFETTKILGTKAPLLPILTVPLYIIFGSSAQIALLVNILFFVIFVFFFFNLARGFVDEKTSMASLLIISTMPLFYGLMRYYLVEFGLMAFVVIFLYLLLRSKLLISKKYLFWLGVVFGLGMMMKFHFFVFIAGPVSFVIYSSWKKIGIRLFNLKNLLVFTLPALAIALPWYGRNILTVLWKAKRATNPELLGALYYGPPFSIKNLYLGGLDFINWVVSGYWFLVIVMILPLIYLFKSKRVHVNYFLLSWFLVPFIIFYFGPNKDYRLMLPLLPPIAILIAWFIQQFFRKRQLVSLLIFMIFPTIVYLNTTVFSAQLIPQRISLGPIVFADNKTGPYVQLPRNEYWPVVEVLKYIAEYSLDDKTKKLILASEDEAFNINGLQYYATRYKLPIKIQSASYFQKGTTYETIQAAIDQGDYLIMKVGGMTGPIGLNRYNDLILKNLNFQIWEEIPNSFILPDGGILKIWRKVS